MKNINTFPKKFSILRAEKNLCILHGQVFVMRDNVVFGALTHVLSLEVLLIRNKANPDTTPQAKFTALYFAFFDYSR